MFGPIFFISGFSVVPGTPHGLLSLSLFSSRNLSSGKMRATEGKSPSLPSRVSFFLPSVQPRTQPLPPRGSPFSPGSRSFHAQFSKAHVPDSPCSPTPSVCLSTGPLTSESTPAPGTQSRTFCLHDSGCSKLLLHREAFVLL